MVTPWPPRTIRAIPLLLVACEERGERHVERAGQSLEAVDRGRYGAVLDFGQHAGRQPRLVCKLGAGQIELAAKIAHLDADRLGDGPARGSLRRERARSSAPRRPSVVRAGSLWNLAYALHLASPWIALSSSAKTCTIRLTSTSPFAAPKSTMISPQETQELALSLDKRSACTTKGD